MPKTNKSARTVVSTGRPFAPPLKSQGIKTKLAPWIGTAVPADFDGRWIEPFMGTGAVVFNIAPPRALLCDTNPHLVAFYSAIKAGAITSVRAREHLSEEGSRLAARGERHYYEIRERFNASHEPLDFLFLNRAGFNGMIRFNRQGALNIPFCRKPQRFSKAYVTKIANQVETVARIIAANDYTFAHQPFETTIDLATEGDLIYCDPPYIDRHVDYYNGWTENDERRLYAKLASTASRFMLSTWHHNIHRSNELLESLWREFNLQTAEHFYHVGASTNNRKPMTEALITNYPAGRALT